MIFAVFIGTCIFWIYTLSLHDALPIWISAFPSPSKSPTGPKRLSAVFRSQPPTRVPFGIIVRTLRVLPSRRRRSEEHTSELQSHVNIVCRLLLEKKKNSKLCLLNFVQ